MNVLETLQRLAELSPDAAVWYDQTEGSLNEYVGLTLEKIAEDVMCGEESADYYATDAVTTFEVDEWDHIYAVVQPVGIDDEPHVVWLNRKKGA